MVTSAISVLDGGLEDPERAVYMSLLQNLLALHQGSSGPGLLDQRAQHLLLADVIQKCDVISLSDRVIAFQSEPGTHSFDDEKNCCKVLF